MKKWDLTGGYLLMLLISNLNRRELATPPERRQTFQQK